MSLELLASLIVDKASGSPRARDEDFDATRRSVLEYCGAKLELMSTQPGAFKECFSSLLALLPEPHALPSSNPQAICVAMEALFRLAQRLDLERAPWWRKLLGVGYL